MRTLTRRHYSDHFSIRAPETFLAQGDLLGTVRETRGPFHRSDQSLSYFIRSTLTVLSLLSRCPSVPRLNTMRLNPYTRGRLRLDSSLWDPVTLTWPRGSTI